MYASWITLALVLFSVWYAAARSSEATKAARDVERRLIEVQEILRFWGEVLPHPERGRVATDDEVRSAEQFLDHRLLTIEERLDARIDKVLGEIADRSKSVSTNLQHLEIAVADLRHDLRHGVIDQ